MRQVGLTLDRILDKLAETFDPDELPDKSTISRYLKRLDGAPPEELAEDAPFRWGGMTDVPWEHSRFVLDAWAYFQNGQLDDAFGPFSFRLAKWIYRLSYAVGLVATDESGSRFLIPEPVEGPVNNPTPPSDHADGHVWTPTVDDVIQIASEYSWREIDSIVRQKSPDTTDLDALMAYTPWRNRIHLDRYHQHRDRLGIFSRVRWHFRDYQWLELVSPKVGRRGLASQEKGAGDTTEAQLKYLRQADGLLYSQHIDYSGYVGRDQAERPPVGEAPWHIQYFVDIQVELKRAK